MRYSDATAEQLNSLMYATVGDVRAEGVGDDVSSDRITKAINQASVRISALTGTVFLKPIPVLITRACVLMAIRFYVPTAAELVELEQERKIVKETTDGHSYEMRDDEYSYSKGPTGDMEVDEIIMLYMKKPTVVGIGTKVVNPII